MKKTLQKAKKNELKFIKKWDKVKIEKQKLIQIKATTGK